MTATAKKHKRRVFGRLKGVEAPGGLYTLELTKSGLRVRKRCCHAVAEVPLARLCEGARTEAECFGLTVEFQLTAEGLELGRKGSKARRLVKYADLWNLGQRQPVLFPDMEGKP